MLHHPVSSTRRLVLALLCLSLASGCGDCGKEDPPSNQNNTMKADMATTAGDMAGDMQTTAGDMAGDMQTTVRDMAGDMQTTGDMQTIGDMQTTGDMAGDMQTTGDMAGDMSALPDQGVVEEVRTCPENLRSSCIFQTLSCFGGAAEFDSCVHDPLLNYDEAQYRSGARGQYRSYESNGMITREFRTISPDGAQCYRALANVTGVDPNAWTVQDFTTQFAYSVVFDLDTVTINCPSGDVEICSRSRFDLFFAWPDEHPMSCPDRDPMMDQCSFDTDCPGDNQCCRPGTGQPNQCFSASFCMPTRPPEYCTTDADCGAGERCKGCVRSGDASRARECVPDNFSELGCLDDACTPGDGTCADPRVCCIQGDRFTCSVPNECDSPPDPNPQCSPSEAQPCAASNQQCCFVSQLNQFRCIDDTAPCRTNVCFNNADCPSNEQCCNNNPTAGTPGTCLEQCGDPVPSCQQDSDCVQFFGGPAVCCVLPGYTVGFCGPDQGACFYRSCESDPNACLSGETCCDAAPLTEAICINNGNQCPPDNMSP